MATPADASHSFSRQSFWNCCSHDVMQASHDSKHNKLKCALLLGDARLNKQSKKHVQVVVVTVSQITKNKPNVFRYARISVLRCVQTLQIHIGVRGEWHHELFNYDGKWNIQANWLRMSCCLQMQKKLNSQNLQFGKFWVRSHIVICSNVSNYPSTVLICDLYVLCVSK